MNTVSPGLTVTRSNPRTTQASGSVRLAVRMSAPAGIGVTWWRLAMTTSDHAPQAIGNRLEQKFNMPRSHSGQSSQELLGSTATASPGFKSFTPGPTACTTAVNSCPGIHGSDLSGNHESNCQPSQ